MFDWVLNTFSIYDIKKQTENNLKNQRDCRNPTLKTIYPRSEGMTGVVACTRNPSILEADLRDSLGLIPIGSLNWWEDCMTTCSPGQEEKPRH